MSFRLPLQNPCAACRLFDRLHDGPLCAHCKDDAEQKHQQISQDIRWWENQFQLPFSISEEWTECDLSDLDFDLEYPVSKAWYESVRELMEANGYREGEE